MTELARLQNSSVGVLGASVTSRALTHSASSPLAVMRAARRISVELVPAPAVP